MAALLAATIAGCGKVYEPEPEARTFELPTGMEIFVSPAEPIDFEQAQAGDLFAGVLTMPIVMEGVVIAPQGAPVAGEIVVEERADAEEVSNVGIRLNRLTIHGGEEAFLETATIFPQEAVVGDEDAQLNENIKFMFVLLAPSEVTWTMDLEPMDSNPI